MYVSYVLQMARLMGYLAFPSSNALLRAIKTDELIVTLLTYSLQSIIFTLNVAPAAPIIKSSALINCKALYSKYHRAMFVI